MIWSSVISISLELYHLEGAHEIKYGLLSQHLYIMHINKDILYYNIHTSPMDF